MAAFVNNQSRAIYAGMVLSVVYQFRSTWKTVESIQCDGQELTQALDILGRATCCNVFTFIGDEAKTIVANWK